MLDGLEPQPADFGLATTLGIQLHSKAGKNACFGAKTSLPMVCQWFANGCQEFAKSLPRLCPRIIINNTPEKPGMKRVKMPVLGQKPVCTDSARVMHGNHYQQHPYTLPIGRLNADEFRLIVDEVAANTLGIQLHRFAPQGVFDARVFHA